MAYYKIAYHVPEERHPDTPPLQVLLHVLGAGRSSRLHQRVLENKGLVSAIDTMELSGRDPGVCLVDAVTDAPKLTDAIVATYDEVHRFQDRAVSDEDLEKALNNVRVGFLSALETVDGQASVMGQFEALGDYRWAAEYPNRIASVTADDIVRVARHYLGFDQSSLLTYTEGEWSELDRSQESAMRDRLASAFAPVGPAPPPAVGGRRCHPPSRGPAPRRARATPASRRSPGCAARHSHEP